MVRMLALVYAATLTPYRIPSIIWQFFWSWCYAPYLLWQVRDIHDVHGWRNQTVYCCFVGYVSEQVGQV